MIALRFFSAGKVTCWHHGDDNNKSTIDQSTQCATVTVFLS